MVKKWKILIYCLLISFWSKGEVMPNSDSLLFTFLGSEYMIITDKSQIQDAIKLLQKNENNENLMPLFNIASIRDFIHQQQKERKLPDWLTYQLIRRIAEQINSKYVDYSLYTLTKFALLSATGYEPVLFKSKDKVLLYIKSANTIYNLPNKIINGFQYVCLNYHDYGYQINFMTENFNQILKEQYQKGKDFDYNIHYLPSFQETSYIEKQILFNYKYKLEKYKILVQPEMQDYFTNYPVMEYRYQFNIPFSKISYDALIPELKKRLTKFNIEDGVEYLMSFVRDGFEFETDTKLFGREKRLSAEETLAYNSSDCEDRSALFFLLVKELYNLPMAILSYPEHVNVAVKLPRQKGQTIEIENEYFTICEPTPQKKKKGIGWMPKAIRKQPFEIAYVYKK